MRQTPTTHRRVPPKVAALIALTAVMIGGSMLLAPRAAVAADDGVDVELNAVEGLQNRCRMSFVIENKTPAAVESLKLDLAVFGKDGVIQRRMLTEMGPLRRAKTIVKAFEVDGECGQVGSVLVNDVTACAPGEPEACLDKLSLTSKVPNVRFYK